MANRIFTAVWEEGPEDRAEAMVLMALADSADAETSFCWPSIARIAERARMSVRSAKYAIQRLEEGGWITVDRERTRPNGAQSSSGYTINLERLGLEDLATIRARKKKTSPAKTAGGPLQKLQGGGAKTAGGAPAKTAGAIRTNQFNKEGAAELGEDNTPKPAEPAEPAQPDLEALSDFQLKQIANGNTVLAKTGALIVPTTELVETAADLLRKRDDAARAARRSL